MGEGVASKLRGVVLPRVWEVLVLTTVIFLVVCLFLIPTISYAVLTRPQTAQSVSPTTSSCSETSVYTGEICRDELLSASRCYQGNGTASTDLKIPAAIDQQRSDTDVLGLFHGLSVLNPSEECRVALVNLICLQTFELCDKDDAIHLVNGETCTNIRDNICPAEWALGTQFPDFFSLPVCEDLPSGSNNCMDFYPIEEALNSSTEITDSIILNVTCEKGLSFDEDTEICTPVCGEFLTRDVFYQRIAISIGFILSLVVFLVVLPVQRKKMLKFPSVIILYSATCAIVITFVVLIGVFDNSKLYCKSRDLMYSTGEGNETVFCIISGVVVTYVSQQLAYFVMWNSLLLLWGIAFPFSYRRVNSSSKMQRIHIGIVASALIAPLLSTLVYFKDGFMGGEYPVPFCVGRNTDITFYFATLPQSIMLGASTIMLILVFWLIFKVLVLKGGMRTAGVDVTKAVKAELKVSLILVYYVIIGTVGLVAATYFLHTRDLVTRDVIDYTHCVVTGNQDCIGLLGDRLGRLSTLSDISLIMLSFGPVLHILFGMNFNTCQEALTMRTSSSKQSTSSKRTAISKQSASSKGHQV